MTHVYMCVRACVCVCVHTATVFNEVINLKLDA